MTKLLFVFAGGGLGSIARYLTGVVALRAFGPNWPYGTFAVNIVGGMLMGVLATTLALRGGADQERWRVLLGVGFMGGFTTFSAFSLEVALMLERRDWLQALGYVFGSVTLAVTALFMGMLLARKVLA
jgi:CrcB protein